MSCIDEQKIVMSESEWYSITLRYSTRVLTSEIVEQIISMKMIFALKMCSDINYHCTGMLIYSFV